MKKALMFLLLVLYSSVAFSVEVDVYVYVDGNYLLNLCENDDIVPRTFCLAYITGVSDTSQSKNWKGLRYCKPNGVVPGQMKKIVTKYLNNHPEKLHLAAYILIQNALLDAFPCE